MTCVVTGVTGVWVDSAFRLEWVLRRTVDSGLRHDFPRKTRQGPFPSFGTHGYAKSSSSTKLSASLPYEGDLQEEGHL